MGYSRKNPNRYSRRGLEDIFEKNLDLLGLSLYLCKLLKKKSSPQEILQNCGSHTLSAWKFSGQKARPIHGRGLDNRQRLHEILRFPNFVRF